MPKDLRAELQSLYPALTDEVIKKMGGVERTIELMSVGTRACDLAQAGAGSFGHCVDEAAKLEEVSLTEKESGQLVLIVARTVMAERGLK